MATAVAKDIPPYVLVSGNPASPHGINNEGLKRRGFSADAIRAIKQAYKTLYLSGSRLEEALATLDQAAEEQDALLPLVSFLKDSTRSIVR
jgi:UDP-N-acetylglucosamine acyltransferase